MAETNSIVAYRLTEHARDEMSRRQIAEAEVAKVLTAPEQIETARAGREVDQSRLQMGEPPRTYLLRVFVDIGCLPPEAVAVYRTSKVAKYWRIET